LDNRDNKDRDFERRVKPGRDRADSIIEKLREMIEEGQSAPLSSGKVILVREEALDLLDLLQDTVQEELKTYREVNDKRAKLLQEAREDAERILFEAERSASRIRVTKHKEDEPVGFSLEAMSREERDALHTANDIYAASMIYTDEMLTEVDHFMADAVDKIEQEYMKMRATLREKQKAISENKAELVRSLNDLSQNDRYAQLVELSELLSVELYREKLKQRARDKEKESQLEIHFDETQSDMGLDGADPRLSDKTIDLGAVKSANSKRPRPVINPDRTEKKIRVDSHAQREGNPRRVKKVSLEDNVNKSGENSSNKGSSNIGSSNIGSSNKGNSNIGSSNIE
jgi:hypothetical protein